MVKESNAFFPTFFLDTAFSYVPWAGLKPAILGLQTCPIMPSSENRISNPDQIATFQAGSSVLLKEQKMAKQGKFLGQRGSLGEPRDSPVFCLQCPIVPRSREKLSPAQCNSQSHRLRCSGWLLIGGPSLPLVGPGAKGQGIWENSPPSSCPHSPLSIMSMLSVKLRFWNDLIVSQVNIGNLRPAL